jgi:hypothetical protein
MKSSKETFVGSRGEFNAALNLIKSNYPCVKTEGEKGFADRTKRMLTVGSNYFSSSFPQKRGTIALAYDTEC